jgi:single-strand DNA-binding protein
MAGSLNRVMILGNLGQDPELRYTPNQNAVATFSVATTDYRTGADGQKQETTEWHRVVVWNKVAENCAKYLTKGKTVLVEGKLQTRSWDDKATGQKRYSTEIIAQNVQFLSPPGPQATQRGEYGQTQNYSGRGAGQNLADGAPSGYGGPAIPDFDMGAPSMPSTGAYSGSDANLDDIPF